MAAVDVRTLLLPLPGPGAATVEDGPGVPGVMVGVLVMEFGTIAVLGVKIGEVIEGEGKFIGDPTRLRPRPVPIEGAGEPILLSGFIMASLIVGVIIPTLMAS